MSSKCARTSVTHPLQIAALTLGDGRGRIGITFCPGKVDPHAVTGAWDRDLGLDLNAIAAWGASAVVTLVEAKELVALKVPNLGEEVLRRHMDWVHLPIPDYTPPLADFEQGWAIAGPGVRNRLRDGFDVLVHCKGGLGRAGTIASRLAVELGMNPKAAIEAVRKVRKGAIETKEQEAHVLACKPVTELAPATDEAARRDRAIGALLGLAVGDAVGTTLEFAKRDDAAPRITDMIGGGPFKLKPGGWTDDTSMALALASQLKTGAFDPKALMGEFVAWWRRGAHSHTGTCFDIGNTTRTALARWEKTGDPIAGAIDTYSAGNGSLMRLSPVAIRYWGDAENRREVAALQSRTTHGATEAVDACVLYADLVAEAIAGVPRDAVLAPRPFGGSDKISSIAGGSWRGKARSKIRGSGYVVDALEAALWCIGRTGNFRDAVLMAANLRDDADTTAAIVGQLAGALYGASGIPEGWRDKVLWREEIESLARQLFALASPAQADTSSSEVENVGQSRTERMFLAPRRVSLAPLQDPAERRALRVIAMVHELHKAGYQKLRISPGISPSGCHWRCHITHAGNVLGDGWTIRDFDTASGELAVYSTGDGSSYFHLPGADKLNARELARAFLAAFPKLAEKGAGRDWVYAGWLTEMLGRAEQGGFGNLVTLYADWEFDSEHLGLWSPPPP